jgi:hypothetical protein
MPECHRTASDAAGSIGRVEFSHVVGSLKNISKNPFSEGKLIERGQQLPANELAKSLVSFRPFVR